MIKSNFEEIFALGITSKSSWRKTLRKKSTYYENGQKPQQEVHQEKFKWSVSTQKYLQPEPQKKNLQIKWIVSYFSPTKLTSAKKWSYSLFSIL